MKTNQLKTTTDSFGRQVNVKYVYLGSMFRQFVLSRTNVNYFHYLWPMCGVVALLAGVVLFLQVCFCVLRNVCLREVGTGQVSPSEIKPARVFE